MDRRLFFGLVCLLFVCDRASAQVPLPFAPYGPYHAYGGGVTYGSPVINGNSGVQVYPFDQQDPWLHGYFQRYPAYHGYNTYRPYNYRHVYAQSQISAQWGAPMGMPYSSQFWNRYRGSYMDGMLHDRTPANTDPFMNPPAGTRPGDINPIGYRSEWRAGSGQSPSGRR
jgi:hypothetical protein